MHCQKLFLQKTKKMKALGIIKSNLTLLTVKQEWQKGPPPKKETENNVWQLTVKQVNW